MATNKVLLNKGIKYLIAAVPQMFIGPAVIYNAFSNKQNNWHYLVLIVGCALCLGGMFCAFYGLKTMVKGIFNDKE